MPKKLVPIMAEIKHLSGKYGISEEDRSNLERKIRQCYSTTLAELRVEKNKHVRK